MGLEQYIKDTRSPLARMLRGEDRPTSEPLDFPGANGVKFRFWELSGDEDIAARKAAFDYVRYERKFSDLDLAYDDQRAKNECVAAFVLAVAIRNADDARTPIAADGVEVLKVLSGDRIAQLYKRYNEYLNEISGWKQVEDIPAELDKIVDLVGKGSTAETVSSWYDITSLRRLLGTSAARLASVQTNRS